jgi:uncharacterized protein
MVMRMARPWLLALVAGATVVLAGCGNSGSTSQTSPPATPTLAQPTATFAVATRDAWFTTTDGVRLGGTLYGKGTTGVALAHQVNGMQSQWKGFAQQLAARGYLALAFDFRGRGISEGTFNTDTEDVDLRTAITYLRAQGATRIVVMGASLGGAVALQVAATEPVVAVATLSAVATFPGQLVTDAVITSIKAPKLFINSAGDAAAHDTQHMYDVASPPKAIHLYSGNAHGVALFGDSNSPDLNERLLTFLATYAPAK